MNLTISTNWSTFVSFPKIRIRGHFVIFTSTTQQFAELIRNLTYPTKSNGISRCIQSYLSEMRFAEVNSVFGSLKSEPSKSAIRVRLSSSRWGPMAARTQLSTEYSRN